ncbi:hypothetical protein ACFLRC_00225 [Candidatus Altiarchaeota archaeon]
MSEDVDEEEVEKKPGVGRVEKPESPVSGEDKKGVDDLDTLKTEFESERKERVKAKVKLESYLKELSKEEEIISEKEEAFEKIVEGKLGEIEKSKSELDEKEEVFEKERQEIQSREQMLDSREHKDEEWEKKLHTREDKLKTIEENLKKEIEELEEENKGEDKIVEQPKKTQLEGKETVDEDNESNVFSSQEEEEKKEDDNG